MILKDFLDKTEHVVKTLIDQKTMLETLGVKLEELPSILKFTKEFKKELEELKKYMDLKIKGLIDKVLQLERIANNLSKRINVYIQK
uniref:Uncharacterized protein n=1 Tax=Ignisphaera aggregans TaxID=334771 RepID=A0A7J2TAG9_9CREN